VDAAFLTAAAAVGAALLGLLLRLQLRLLLNSSVTSLCKMIGKCGAQASNFLPTLCSMLRHLVTESAQNVVPSHCRECFTAFAQEHDSLIILNLRMDDSFTFQNWIDVAQL